jgi:hypothetical protein
MVEKEEWQDAPRCRRAGSPYGKVSLLVIADGCLHGTARAFLQIICNREPKDKRLVDLGSILQCGCDMP